MNYRIDVAENRAFDLRRVPPKFHLVMRAARARLGSLATMNSTASRSPPTGSDRAQPIEDNQGVVSQLSMTSGVQDCGDPVGHQVELGLLDGKRR
jgi:hypothetical protein